METPTLLKTSPLPWENQPFLHTALNYHELPKVEYIDDSLLWLLERSRHYPHLRTALKSWVREDNDENRLRIYEFFRGRQLSYRQEDIVPALEKLNLDKAKLRERARWLLENASHIEALQFALILLSVCGDERDLPDLQHLGHYEYFSEFCVDAILKIAPEPLDVLWAMARKHKDDTPAPVFKALVPFARNNSELSDWIFQLAAESRFIRHLSAGFMADAGNLIGRLRREFLSDEELDRCCRVVELVLNPPLFINDLGAIESGSELPEIMISLLEVRCDRTSRLHTVAILREWLNTNQFPPYDAKKRIVPNGWTIEKWSNWLKRCNAIFDSRDWSAMVREDYEANPTGDFAWDISELVGLDLWEAEFERQKHISLREGSRFQPRLVRHPSLGIATGQGKTREPSRLQQIMKWAGSSWPLEELELWPPNEPYNHEQRQIQTPLEASINMLVRFQQAGAFDPTLTLAALRSAFLWHRLVMVLTLRRCPRELWTPEIEERLEWLRLHDENQDIQEALEKLSVAVQET